MPTADDTLLGGVAQLYATGEGYWILDSVPRQWVLRKRERGEGEDAQSDLAQLKAAVEEDEDGVAEAESREYVPLHDGDRAALRLYEEAVALLEAGRAREAGAKFRQAASASPSVALHFKLHYST